MLSEKKQLSFLHIAKVIGNNSKCLSRQLGAVLVTPDGTIVGTGYNGPARGVPHCNSQERFDYLIKRANFLVKQNMTDNWGKQCPRKLMGFKSGEGLDYCQAGHAERNCIVNAAREGIRTKGCWLVSYSPWPCVPCAIEIVNAGITHVVCLDEIYEEGTKFIFKYGKVKVITWSQEQIEEEFHRKFC